MDFVPFVSISNLTNYHKKNIVDNDYDFRHNKWIAVEKLHGVNLAVYSDGEKIQVASREGFLSYGGFDVGNEARSREKFYGYRPVVAKYEDLFIKVAKPFLSMWNNAFDAKVPPFVRFVGELFGKGIHKGTGYGDKDFAVFDFCVVFSLEDYDTVKKFVDKSGAYVIQKTDTHALVYYMNKHAELDHLEALRLRVPNYKLFTNFEGVKDINPDFISAEADLSMLISTSTTVEEARLRAKAEGWVIEPNNPSFDCNGGRFIYKIKARDFSQRNGLKNPTYNAKFLVTLNEEQKCVLCDMIDMIDLNRYQGMMPKLFGDVKPKISNFNLVAEAITDDILYEYQRDNGADSLISVGFSGFLGKNMERVLRNHVGNFIKPLLLDII